MYTRRAAKSTTAFWSDGITDRLKVRLHRMRCVAVSCGMRQKRRNVPHDVAPQRNATHPVRTNLYIQAIYAGRIVRNIVVCLLDYER